MEKTKTLIRLYHDEFSSIIIWNNILKALGIPIEEAEYYYTILLSVGGYSFDTGPETKEKII